MTAVQPGATQPVPQGRYGGGPDADARADRTLRRLAIVLGSLLAVVVGYFAWHTLEPSRISAQVVAFKAVSDQSLEIHLEVHKGAGAVAICTVRSEDADHNEVGRKDVRITEHAKEVDTVVTLRTTSRGTTGELVGCQNAPKSSTS
ncbi:protein of unknown function [Actinacidiphila yanglinensis]|uniref:DUF4307 domain-containing protein n=1 Tax=Actinacidiphila yanglinensis TaxID=310779 RepID=A0A1H5UVR0_9ACTN|nr:DUF4307 domain-containing protein [Actinacidiphila yanglinensis]SEF79175.1 protein of unknown function [Actinacidiphila yanglinensis]